MSNFLQNETVRLENQKKKLEKEEVAGKCSVKKVFLKTSQNSQEKLLLEFLF